MSNEVIDLMRRILRYSPRRAYFGKFIPQHMYDSYKKFKKTEKWDDPVTQDIVTVGYISGVEICRALWNQASYNPKRFGDKSPFLHEGKEDIQYFYYNGVPKDFPGAEIWEKVRNIIGEFLELNDDPYCEDNAVISTNRGVVRIKLVDGGFTNINYQKLAKLTEMIRVIITQNLKDVNRKSYNGDMLKVMLTRHPKIFENIVQSCVEKTKKPVAEPNTIVSNNVIPYTVDETMDDAEDERIQIEIDKIWKKTDKMISVEEYKDKELEDSRFVSFEQYRLSCEKLKANSRGVKSR